MCKIGTCWRRTKLNFLDVDISSLSQLEPLTTELRRKMAALVSTRLLVMILLV